MDTKEIKAETWIAVHHPSVGQWTARLQGVFSRNYAADLRSCEADHATVELSRDGLYEILPNALFFTGRELQGKEGTDFKWTERVLKQRFERIKTVMTPFDSSYFNHSLALETTVNQTLDDGLSTLLRTLAGIDLDQETDPYIRSMAPLVLQAAKVRGDYRLLCRAMTCILGYKTECRLKNGTVRFVVHRPDLSHAELLSYVEALKPFFRFVEEWFVPFEMQCDYKVRDYGRDDRFDGPNRMMLDYNATLGNSPVKPSLEP